MRFVLKRREVTSSWRKFCVYFFELHSMTCICNYRCSLSWITFFFSNGTVIFILVSSCFTVFWTWKMLHKCKVLFYLWTGSLNLFTCMNLCSNSSLPVISLYLLQLVLLGIDGLAENKAEFFIIFLRIT